MCQDVGVFEKDLPTARWTIQVGVETGAYLRQT